MNPSSKADTAAFQRFDTATPSASVPLEAKAALTPEELAQATKRLFWAAEHGDLEAVLQSIEKVENVDLKDRRHSKTALHWAAEKGFENVLTALLAKDADVRSLDRYGETPLHYAADNGRTQVVSILLKYHSDPSTLDRRGRTALRCARDKGHSKVVRLLLPTWNGQINDLEVKDAQGRTIVEWAAALDCQHDMARFTELMFGKSATSTDNHDRTPAQDIEEMMKEAFSAILKI